MTEVPAAMEWREDSRASFAIIFCAPTVTLNAIATCQNISLFDSAMLIIIMIMIII